ncbi:MAG: leucine-rich repeat domain-containing protein [Planctomycetaceae bacterium]|jgi:hypothetical protein
MAADEVPGHWRWRRIWLGLPRSLLLFVALLAIPPLVYELAGVWSWFSIHSAARRLERWNQSGEPGSGVLVAVALQPRPWVKQLGLGLRFRDSCAAYCPWLADTPHVVSISLVGPHYDDAALEFAAAQFPNVLQLRLEGCTVTGKGLRGLKRWPLLGSVQLEEMSLSGHELSALDGLPALKTLEISSCSGLDDAALESFPALPELRLLNLETSGIESTGLQYLRGLPSLQKLNLRDDLLTDEALLALPSLPRLKLLSVHSTQISGHCLEHLCQLPALTVLEIDGSPMDDAGLQFLPDNSTLRGLFLVGTTIHGPGLPALSRLTALDDLSLAQAPLTDDSLEFLPNLPRLQAFNLSETQITPLAFLILHQRCPVLKNLLVTHSDRLTPTDLARWDDFAQGLWRFHTGWKSAREVERLQRAAGETSPASPPAQAPVRPSTNLP